MSADDKDPGCAELSVKTDDATKGQRDTSIDEVREKKSDKAQRKVAFPDDEHIVTEYFEPANPWHNVPSLTKAQLAAEYLESCRRHNTPPIDSVLEQIRELPESAIGGGSRATRLTLSECSLQGAAPADALEALLRRTQFRRIEIDHALIDDEGAEALFDMVEYYESATAVSVCGPRAFGVRGWQAVCRMIKKSCQLAELEITNSPLEPNHAPVLSRALHAFSCKLRVLCLQRTLLSGDSLVCLVIALRTNNSIRELRLGDNDLRPSDAAQLALLLRYNTRLQLLDLSNNQIQDAGAAHIAEALAEQSTQTPPSVNTSPMSPHYCPMSNYETRGLVFLVLWNNQLTRNCANYLSKALSSKSLRVLNVGRNAVSSEGARAIASVKCGQLVSLGLQAARLGPSAGRPLAELVRAGSRLQRLDLRDNKLGEQGLQAILQALNENSSLTQIDLDEPTETSSLSAEDSESATISRLTREIRAVCRKNEPTATSPERRVHRKISLTCHSTCIPRAMEPPIDRPPLPSRLRSPLPSPAPSPAGSPIPNMHNRFSVTRVTPERESSTESSSPTTPTRTSYCPTSRFRVVQVAEPPKIQVHSAEPRRSRFSVTRNYDTMYNPTSSDSSASSPASGTSSPAPDVFAASGSSSPAAEVMAASGSSSPAPEVMTASGATSLAHEVMAASGSSSPATDVMAASGTSSPAVEVMTASGATSLAHGVMAASGTPSAAAEVMAKDSNELSTDDETSNDNAKDSVTSKERNSSTGVKIGLTSENASRNSSTGVKNDLTKDSLNDNATRDLTRDVTIKDSVRNTSIGAKFDPKRDSVTNKDSTRNISTEIDLTRDSVTSDDTRNSSTDAKIDIAKESVSENAARNICTGVKIDPNRDSVTSEDSARKSSTGVETDLTSDSFSDNAAKNSLTGVKIEDITDSSTESLVPEDRNRGRTDLSLSANGNSASDVDNVVNANLTSAIENSKTVGGHLSDTKPVDNLSTVIERLESVDNNLSRTDKSVSDLSGVNDNIKSVNDNYDSDCSKIISENLIAISDQLSSASDNLKCVSDVSGDSVSTYHDSEERLSHNASVDNVYGTPVLKTETKLVKNSTEVNLSEKVDVQVDLTVKSELNLDKSTKVHKNQNKPEPHKEGEAMRHIEAITEDLGNLIQEMKELSTKTAILKKDSIKVRNDSTQTVDIGVNIEKVDKDVPGNIRDSVVLKKNRSESSLDSPDLEVSRLMNKKLVGSPFCDSSSSLEISGSSMESLNMDHGQNLEQIIIKLNEGRDRELDRRKCEHTTLSAESSIESNTSEVTPVNSAFLNTSVSSTDSVSPIFPKKTHGSLSSLEASVSSMDSKQLMVTSADSGIEHSLHHPEVDTSNEGTLTNNSCLMDIKTKDSEQDTLTAPKRVSSMVDVQTSKKNTDRTRKISWVAPSPSYHLQKPEPEKQETKLPSHLEKLLSLFHHPTSLFRSSNEDEKKSASSTPPRKDSSLTSSFWSWGSTTEKENEKDDISETTDSTLSERVQVSFVDESFSKKLGSKTPSTDTENTLSEFQSIQGNSDSEVMEKVTKTTDQVQIGLNCDNNDLTLEKKVDEEKTDEVIRPRTFAAVLKSSGSENSLDKQTSPEGQSVDKLPSKVIRGIKENISPENTLTSSMTNTKTLALDLCERQIKNPIVNAVWELSTPLLEGRDEAKTHTATIEETCEVPLEYEDLKYIDEKNVSTDSGVTSLEGASDEKKFEAKMDVDLGKDALSYLIYENQDFEPDENVSDYKTDQSSLAQELKEAEIKEKEIDLSPELVIDEAIEVPVFLKDVTVIPERAKLKKANSLEDLPSEKESSKTKTIAFKIPETTPQDIPERRSKLRSRSGSSPKSLPESLNKPCPLAKMDGKKKKKKVSSLGKIARDSLLALNMSEEELNEFRKSYKLTSVESLRSLESVSENSQSGTSIDSRCHSCWRTSQESLMSLDSITEDCKCEEKPGRSAR